MYRSMVLLFNIETINVTGTRKHNTNRNSANSKPI
jgi:hypothetical protein